MDFGDLIILLLFLAPVLRRIFGGKQQPKPKPIPPSEGTTSREIEDPLAEALRQIREALGEDEETSGNPDEEPYAPQFEPEPRPASKFKPEFRPLGEFEHEAHGFGRENPISEEVFEQRPAFVTAPATKPIRVKPQEAVDLTTPLEVTKAATPAASTGIAQMLRDPKQARDAFVLYEVFGPPKSKRG